MTRSDEALKELAASMAHDLMSHLGIGHGGLVVRQCHKLAMMTIIPVVGIEVYTGYGMNEYSLAQRILKSLRKAC